MSKRFYDVTVQMSLVVRKPLFGVFDHRAVQPQKMARGLKIRMYVVEGLYYPYTSENKGADQLRGYCATDLRLCFRICKKPVSSRHGSNNVSILLLRQHITRTVSSQLYNRNSNILRPSRHLVHSKLRPQ